MDCGSRESETMKSRPGVCSLLDSGHVLWAVYWQQEDRSDVSVASSLSVFDRP